MDLEAVIYELKGMRKVAMHNWSVNIWGDEGGLAEDAAWLSIAKGCERAAQALGVDIT